MFKLTPNRITAKHVVLCLLVLAALLGMTVAAAAHIHQDADMHEGQCALCMSCAQMVAVCVAVMVALFVSLMKEETFFQVESQRLIAWIPPAQRVRPPPFL